MIRILTLTLAIGFAPNPTFAGSLPMASDPGVMDLFYKVICSPNTSEITDPSAFEARNAFQAFLKSPRSEALRLIQVGSRDNTGHFGLLIMCGSISGFEQLMNQRGCYDEHGDVIDHTSAVAFCAGVTEGRRRHPTAP